MMSRHLSICLIAPVVGVLVAGCGGGSKSATTAGSPVAPASSAPTGTAQAPSAGGSGPTGSTGTGTVQEAVAICRGLLRLSSNLSSSERARLEGICDKAESGSLAEARVHVTEVCSGVINSLPLAAASKEAALAGCKAKVK